MAADQGDAEAQQKLALMYITGEGVPEDYVEVSLGLTLPALLEEMSQDSRR